MAIEAYIGMPRIAQEAGSNQVAVQKPPITEASSQSWLAGMFCYTSGTGASTVLNACASDAVLIYGMAAKAAVGSGSVNPPNTLFGTSHYPFEVRDRIIEMNIANSSSSGATIGTSNGVTWAGGGTNGVALAPGQQYAIVVPTSGTYAGIPFVDVTDTTNKLVEIVALAPGRLTTDASPRVWVKIIPDKIQA